MSTHYYTLVDIVKRNITVRSVIRFNNYFKMKKKPYTLNSVQLKNKNKTKHARAFSPKPISTQLRTSFETIKSNGKYSYTLREIGARARLSMRRSLRAGEIIKRTRKLCNAFTPAYVSRGGRYYTLSPMRFYGQSAAENDGDAER